MLIGLGGKLLIVFFFVPFLSFPLHLCVSNVGLLSRLSCVLFHSVCVDADSGAPDQDQCSEGCCIRPYPEFSVS